MVKQIVLVGVIFLAVEYYCFIALNLLVRKMNSRLYFGFMIIYVILSLCVLYSLYLSWLWETTTSPGATVKLFVNAFVGVFVAKILVATIMALGDAAILAKKIVSGLYPFMIKNNTKGQNLISRGEFVSKSALFAGGLLFSGLLYGVTKRYDYKIKKLSLSLGKPLNGLRGLRIVHISDIHSGSFDNIEAVSEGVRLIMEQRPDIILFTGDLVNHRASEIVPYIGLFKTLKAPLGIYSVLGNHDYGDYVNWGSKKEKEENLKLLKYYQAEMGWQLLTDESVILEHGTEKLAIIGVENWSAKGNFSRYGNMAKAVQNLTDNHDISLKVLMSHDPSHWDAEIRKRYPDIALTFSGHTHGMQFGIDIPSLKWSPVQYFYKQWAGLYQEGSQFLYVNRGFGYIGYQGRLGILPEITVLDLA